MAVIGKSEDPNRRDVLAAEQVDALEFAAVRCKSEHRSVRDFRDSRKIDGNETFETRQYACERRVCEGAAVEEGDTFEAGALSEAAKDQIGEVRTNREEVESTYKLSVCESLVIAGEDAHDLDYSGIIGDGRLVP